jgi:predicted lipoprotein with Yx(FWY)xxD motif
VILGQSECSKSDVGSEKKEGKAMQKKIIFCLILTLILVIGGWTSATGIKAAESDEFTSTWYCYLNPGQRPTVADVEAYNKSYGDYPILTEEQARYIIIPSKRVTSNRETYLVDAKGMTLYLFDKDKEAGKSTCYGGCAKSWPPYTPAVGQSEPVSPLTVIARDDGTKQYAYKGKPLYYYAKDGRPGDVKGEGVGKAWWIVKP